MPLGPNVLLTRSPTAMAPTKADWMMRLGLSTYQASIFSSFLGSVFTKDICNGRLKGLDYWTSARGADLQRKRKEDETYSSKHLSSTPAYIHNTRLTPRLPADCYLPLCDENETQNLVTWRKNKRLAPLFKGFFIQNLICTSKTGRTTRWTRFLL